MNITVTVTHTVTPELLAVLQALSTPHGTQVTPVIEMKTEKAAKASKTPKAEKEAAVVDLNETTITQEPAPTTGEYPGPALTLTQIRDKAIPLSKGGHKDAIKAKYKEFQPEIDSINSLDPVHFPAMWEYLNTLKVN